MLRFDICIAGAGIVGLALALELEQHGLAVAVLERGDPMREASTAAAGMLAADDPENPAALSDLSHLSISLYPSFLDRIAQTGRTPVPFQTAHTLQSFRSPSEDDHASLSPELLASLISSNPPSRIRAMPDLLSFLDERSVDPRQLAPSLLAAVTSGGARILSGSPVVSTSTDTAKTVRIRTAAETIEAARFIDCTGAWARDASVPVVPIKGQMLAVALPSSFPLQTTVRTRDLYIVPRTAGPNAGRAIIGATIEDAGFDKTLHREQIAHLHRQAVVLLPPLAGSAILESWAGLRPATPDRLPIIGPHPAKPHHWIASGHYRNGILLAPATARVMAELLLGNKPSVPLEAFVPSRQQLFAISTNL